LTQAPEIAPPPHRTREKLIQATIELLRAGGYSSASVAAIAAKAGVASGTLYRHYRSKQALFVEVFRAVCDREYAAMNEAAQTDGPASDRLAAVAEVFARRALRNPRLAWALIAEPVDVLVDAERLAFRQRYCELITALLDEGVAAGELPPQDTELAAAALVGAIGDALVGPLSPVSRNRRTDDEVVAALLLFCGRAVGRIATVQ
jgi:AcrR family transcriptional regulator